ncbi:hypothetical protein ABVN58_05605 [Fusobacterium polymorphum]|jgi:hypothetical protein fuD12_02769|uniref:Uncharacterized protein n=1 Tax=Fusobacterium nucleatum CTI-6 TaxID=1316587 RepID=U7TTP1_FUSNU|nr:hypothetical protein [Fusobacterium nucleatum]ERT47649.1 hypothetical protein HMPREF1767_01209 [Fusobacterium nucleatum CTI-6]DAT14781.1 MAG TPA: hypothetical protein [Caudoviricetes sp.]
MFFYLNKESLLNGEVVIIFQTENQIPNYKEITNFGELVEFKGESIPANWEYSLAEDMLYDIKDKPSPYHILKNKKWVVEDKEGFKEYCNTKINTVKNEILDYGFDYEINKVKHRQKCRVKDITFMAITALVMFLVKTFLHKDITRTWYFEDDFGYEMDMVKLVQLMFYGSNFVQSVYDTENFFKLLEEPKLINKDDYLAKIKDFMEGGN